MNNINYSTNYTKLVRISEDDLQWLKDNKGSETVAGFLSSLIKDCK